MASAPVLLELFRATLREQLEPDGWTAVRDPATLAGFARPIDEEFIAVVDVDKQWIAPDLGATVSTEVDAGVVYLPLGRLWAPLGARVREPRFLRSLHAPDDDGEEIPEWQIRSADDASAVAVRVAALVHDQAFAFAA